MQLGYSILFSIQLPHEYYTLLAGEDFELKPTAACAELMRNQAIIWRQSGHKLSILVQSEDGPANQQLLFKLIDPAAVFGFYLKLKRASILNVSNLDWTPSSSKRLYFTNLHQNKVVAANPAPPPATLTSLYLTRPIAAYNSASAYQPGALAKAAAGNKIFEAIKGSKSPGNIHNPENLADPDRLKYWAERGEFQYVSGADMLECTGPFYTYTPAVASDNYLVKVSGLNRATNAYDLPAADDLLLTFSEVQPAVIIDLSKLKPGKYRLQVNGETPVDLYYDSQLFGPGVMGLIEIFNHLDKASDFSLLGETPSPGPGIPAQLNILKNPAFTIRFANRRTIWRYIAQTSLLQDVTDSGGKYSFTAAGLEFTSNQPIPLSQTPLKTLKVEFSSSSPPEPEGPLQNPSPDIQRRLTDSDGDTYYCSEIYLNY